MEESGRVGRRHHDRLDLGHAHGNVHARILLRPYRRITGSARPVVGTVNGNAVAWTLSLPDCPSVGTWVGHFQTVDAQEQLSMLWTLALQESPPGVGSTFTGSAVFLRQSAR